MSNPIRNQWWIIALVTAILAIVACLTYRAFYSIRLDESLLMEALAVEHGWQGIIPGTTTKDEALTILTKSPYVRQVSIQEPPGDQLAGSKVEYIYWDNQRLSFWVGASPRLTNMGVVVDGRVAAIRLHLNGDIVTEQAVAHFGAPSAIAWHETQDWQGSTYVAAYLLYPEDGFVLHSITSFSEEIAPESPVTRVYYFEPMSVDELNGMTGRVLHLDLDQMEDWSGYY